MLTAFHWRVVIETVKGTPVGGIARLCGKTEAQVQRVLGKAVVKEEVERLSRAAAVVAVEKAASAMEVVALRQVQAAGVLVAAMERAVEDGDVKQMRECAVAVLAHGGNGPKKEAVEVRHLHAVARITDPEVLRRIAATGEVPMLEGK